MRYSSSLISRRNMPDGSALYRRLRALARRGRPVSGGHHLCSRKYESRRPHRRRQSTQQCRFRASDPAAPAASSLAAIHRSRERRRKRLEERLREEPLFPDGAPRLARSPALPSHDPDELEEAPGGSWPGSSQARRAAITAPTAIRSCA